MELNATARLTTAKMALETLLNEWDAVSIADSFSFG
jgi:hypothetical protein